jgi:hypothetical protein
MDAVMAESSKLFFSPMRFYGRTLAEYQKIFAIDFSRWVGKSILDCPASGSSFVAESHQRGLRAIAVDPQYGRSVSELREKGKLDIAKEIQSVNEQYDRYNWLSYSSPEALGEFRQVALERFLRDFPAGVIQGRYVRASLPKLPFDDGQFDLVLSGSFFFLFESQFDYDFHLASLLELFRVCRGEVRIYPIVGADGLRYYQLDKLIDELRGRGIGAEFIDVSFEFCRGSNQLLRLTWV